MYTALPMDWRRVLFANWPVDLNLRTDVTHDGVYFSSLDAQGIPGVTTIASPNRRA